MSPLAALFVDNSFTMPLTKSLLIGLNEILFTFLIFYLIFLTLGWSADFFIIFSILSQMEYLYFPAPGPLFGPWPWPQNLYLLALAPNFYLPTLALNLYLPALAPNVC